MDIANRHVIVTGAAGGIGGAIARRLHAAGARGVVVADRDTAGVNALADELNDARANSALAISADIGTTNEVTRLIDMAESRYGTVDLYAANAGVALGTDLETTDTDWDTAFNINVKSHYFAARRLVPTWLARGEGYFVSTASAAGLLSQIGSAPYSVTKHAAVAFAEWLSITYGDQGVRVSCLCPQGVNTNMLNSGVDSAGASAVRAGGVVLEPADVAEVVLAAIVAEKFLILPHPEVLTYWQRKTTDIDRWLAGMRRLQARIASSA